MGTLHDLTIYKKAIQLVSKIYLLIEVNNKLKNDFSLCDQIKRASISVACNISEGYYRSSRQSKNYYHIASASANEVITLLEIINNVYAINIGEIREEYQYLAKQINSFCSSF